MIWLIGSHGMLGCEVAKLLTANNISWIGSNSEVDISNPTALENFATSHDQASGQTGMAASKGTVPTKITWVINCAAYTQVDKAESETEKAKQINYNGARNIARVARKLSAKLIHISTDYVFDGMSLIPYTEEDSKNPTGVYGKTKSDGEDSIQNEMTQYYILRTSWLYGFNGKNFVYTMMRLMNEKPQITVVNDQRGTPTNAVNLATTILKIINVSENAHSLFGRKAAIPYGIYHVTDKGETTWFDFANKIFLYGKKYGRIKQDCKVLPCSTQEYPTVAKRPAYSVLSKTKIQNALKVKFPKWEDSLENFIKSERFDIK